MRIAVLILGLAFSLFSGLQSCAVHVGGRLSDSTATAGAGAIGIALSLLFLLGSALVIAVPRAAQVSFIIAAVIAFINRTAFPDLLIWGVISIALSLMSYYGNRELKKQKAKAMAKPETT